jgi:hypothetical protein
MNRKSWFKAYPYLAHHSSTQHDRSITRLLESISDGVGVDVTTGGIGVGVLRRRMHWY